MYSGGVARGFEPQEAVLRAAAPGNLLCSLRKSTGSLELPVASSASELHLQGGACLHSQPAQS